MPSRVPRSKSRSRLKHYYDYYYYDYYDYYYYYYYYYYSYYYLLLRRRLLLLLLLLLPTTTATTTTTTTATTTTSYYYYYDYDDDCDCYHYDQYDHYKGLLELSVLLDDRAPCEMSFVLLFAIEPKIAEVAVDRLRGLLSAGGYRR